jgi:uncharacterized protein DUF2530
VDPQTTPPGGGEPAPEVTTHQIGGRTFIVADVEPLDIDGVRTMAVGAGLWIVAFVLLLPFYGSLEENDKTWWLWTCVAGFGLGMFGVEYCRRRKRARQAAERPH